MFGDITTNSSINRVILALHNEDFRIINDKVLHLIEVETNSYYSIDYATHEGVEQTDDNMHLNYPIEIKHFTK